jgi:indolepyruvate ferredoxin oxidoreductase
MAHDVTLEDKYDLPQGRVYMTGTQALVRLLLAQKARDAAAGLNTGGFVSGYRGSPLWTRKCGRPASACRRPASSSSPG